MKRFHRLPCKGGLLSTVSYGRVALKPILHDAQNVCALTKVGTVLNLGALSQSVCFFYSVLKTKNKTLCWCIFFFIPTSFPGSFPWLGGGAGKGPGIGWSHDVGTPKYLGCNKLTCVKRNFQDGGLLEFSRPAPKPGKRPWEGSCFHP